MPGLHLTPACMDDCVEMRERAFPAVCLERHARGGEEMSLPIEVPVFHIPIATKTPAITGIAADEEVSV